MTRLARVARPILFTTAALAAVFLSACDAGGDSAADVDPMAPHDESVSERSFALTSDTLEQYAGKCDAEIGVTVPDFNCDDGTLVPTTHINGNKCDQPNRLNRECDPGSKFQVLTNNADAFVVAHCRKQGHAAGQFGDIAVIQYNKHNGATCFYQALGSLDGRVKAPSRGTGAWPWLTPANTAGIGCAGCHDNGPLIRSPYLTQISGPNQLPGAHDVTFNRNQPYRFVGNDFSTWKAFKVEVQGNLCNNCHRLAVNNVRSSQGTALDLGLRATAPSEVAKNPHSADSPIWMLPGTITYSASNENAAKQIAACGLAFQNQESLPSGCTVTEYTGFKASAGFNMFVQSYAPLLNFGLPTTWQAIEGDFNGDHKGDYARLGGTGAWVFFSNGDGTFVRTFQSYVDQSPVLDFGEDSPWQPATGDFNGDGRTDYARLGGTGAWVFFGNADKTFSRNFHAYPGLNFGLPTTWQVVTGDFNDDNRTDYARLGGTGAWVFYGNADTSFTRTFQSYVDESPALDFGEDSPWQSISGDFNGDGKSDYARLGGTGAWVFFGNANKTFSRNFHAYPGLNFGLPTTWQVVTGDFNDDNRTDYARLGGTGAWVLFGNADTSFTRKFQSYVDQSPVLDFGEDSAWQSIAGDFNGDGKGDYARLGSTGAWLFTGNADKTFTRGFQTYDGQSFGLPSSFQVVTGDFRGNHRTSYARLGGTEAFIFLHE